MSDEPISDDTALRARQSRAANGDKGMKRPLFVLATEGKTREQMKAEARAALAAALTAEDTDQDTADDTERH